VKDVGTAVKIDGVNVPEYGYCKTVLGTEVTKIHIFAGKGTDIEHRDAPRLCARYGGEIEDWQKARGEVVLDIDGENIRAEVHWVQEDAVGFFEPKFIRTLK
jgi:hypothetical protein